MQGPKGGCCTAEGQKYCFFPRREFFVCRCTPDRYTSAAGMRRPCTCPEAAFEAAVKKQLEQRESKKEGKASGKVSGKAAGKRKANSQEAAADEATDVGDEEDPEVRAAGRRHPTQPPARLHRTCAPPTRAPPPPPPQ